MTTNLNEALLKIWKRLPCVDRARQIPSDDTHRLGRCRNVDCPYTGWHAR